MNAYVAAGYATYVLRRAHVLRERVEAGVLRARSAQVQERTT